MMRSVEKHSCPWLATAGRRQRLYKHAHKHQITTRRARECSLLQVSILQHHCRSFLAQLHRDWLEVFRAHLANLLSNRSATDEVNLSDGLVRNDGFSGFGGIFALDLYDIDDTLGDASFRKAMRKQVVRLWAEFGSFKHGSAASSEHLTDRSDR